MSEIMMKNANYFEVIIITQNCRFVLSNISGGQNTKLCEKLTINVSISDFAREVALFDFDKNITIKNFRHV